MQTTSPKRTFMRANKADKVEHNKKLERLIESVRNTPFLWDSFHTEYRNLEKKERAWCEIAKQLNFSDGKHVKATWKILRDNFRESLLRRFKLKKANLKGKKWRFTKQMSFTVPHMGIRGKKCLEIFNELLQEESKEEVTDINEVPDVIETPKEVQDPFVIQNLKLNQQDQKMVHIPVVLQLSKLSQNSESSITLSQNLDNKSQCSEGDEKTNVICISEIFYNSSKMTQSPDIIQNSELPQSSEENLPYISDCDKNGNENKDSGRLSQQKIMKTTSDTPHISDCDMDINGSGLTQSPEENFLHTPDCGKNGNEIKDSDRLLQRKRMKTTSDTTHIIDGDMNGDDDKDLTSHLKRKRRKATDSSSSFFMLNNGKEIKEPNCGIKGDALLNFFTSMYKTTLQLPPPMQLQVKRKVFEIVMEAEESCLLLEQSQF